MEYIMVVGVLLLLLAPLVYFGVSRTRDSIEYNEAQETLNILSSTIESLNKLGPGNSKLVEIYIPQGIQEFSTDESELYMLINSDGTESSVEIYTGVFLTSENLPTSQGNHKIYLIMKENDTLHLCTPGCDDIECGMGCGIDCGSCRTNQICSNSFCICNTGYEDCDGNPENGCEAIDSCYQWETGDWSTCSTANSCGTGTQTRDVYCEHIFNGVIVDDSFCTGTKPNESQSCTVRPCSYTCCGSGSCCATGYTYASCGGNECGKDHIGCQCVWTG